MFYPVLNNQHFLLFAPRLHAVYETLDRWRNGRKKTLNTSFSLENDLFRQKIGSFNDQLFNPDLEKPKEPTVIQVDLNRFLRNNY